MTPEELYVLLLPLLLRVGERRFRIARDEAEAIAHDAFITYLGAKRPVHNPRAYLIAAMYNGCRSYWRKQGRMVTGEPLPELSFEPPHVARLTAHALLRRLSEREQRVLWLRAYGYTVGEIASQLHLSVSGTEKIVRRARQAAVAAAEGAEKTQLRPGGGSVCVKDTYRCSGPARDGRRRGASYHSRPCTSSTRCCCTSYSSSRCPSSCWPASSAASTSSTFRRGWASTNIARTRTTSGSTPSRSVRRSRPVRSSMRS